MEGANGISKGSISLKKELQQVLHSVLKEDIVDEIN